MNARFPLNRVNTAAKGFRFALLIILIAVSLAPAIARESPQRIRRKISRKNANMAYEKVCGADVRPKQVLFNLNGCPEKFSFLNSIDNLQAIVKASIDRTLVLEPVGDGCVVLAKSSEKSVPQLILAFKNFFSQRTLEVNTLLKQAGLENLRSDYIEPNFIVRANDLDLPLSPSREPNDDKYVQRELWGLLNPVFRGLDIDARGAWEYSTGSKSIVVGIVDTGIYYSHPDLAANMWTAPTSFPVVIGGRKITCGKGTYGYNALAKPGNECDPADDNGHGTHVAGVVGAVGDNRIGVVGVNWTVELMALKFLNSAKQGAVSDAINAIEFALQAPANLKVLNNSWGVTFNSNCPFESSALRKAVAKAESRGVLFVASAGENSADNDTQPHYPSGYNLTNVISVTALNNDGALTTIQSVGSNLGKTSVHIAAPGDDIWSTCLPQKGYYCQKSFTSVAAPFVSGAGALMFSIPRCAQLGAGGIKKKILEGAVLTNSMINPITQEKLTVTGGRLNLADSIALCF
jgi:thermitase